MAENGAYVISWGTVRPNVGVPKAMEVLAKSLSYYEGLQKDGRVTGYRVYASTQGMRGFLVLEGTRGELAAIAVEKQSLDLLAQAGQVVDDLRTELYAGGSPDDATEYYLNGIVAMQEIGLGS